MEVSEDQFHRRDFPFGVQVHRDAPAVVPHRAGAVHVQGDLDAFAKPGQVLVNRVVQHLEHTVVQPALVRVADVHPRALAHRLQAFELVNLGGVVLFEHWV